ncbi:MAG: enoyl-CoA hydratase/isomerase family protein [Rubrivivax sp.]|nr:enoyl-CoA hydratase/isomerase family protein [Burkholderiales bacterium]MCW5637062.1 enoyl-CoA hydratase/isomerase family protein [Rubrivivax sp.]
MSQQATTVATEGDVTTITLNRPERMNALTRAMIDEIIAVLDAANAGSDTRVVVLTGAGRGFCGGADLKDLNSPQGLLPSDSPESKRQGLRHGVQPLIRALRDCDVPVIAMVNGDAAAGGCDLALACDIRIGSERTRFMESFARIGLFPGTGGCWFLPRMVGLSKAAEMVFTGDPIGAQEAYQWGLISQLVPHAELLDRTMVLARRIAAGPPIALRLAKMVMHRGVDMSLETSLELAAASESITLTSDDHREGLAAFLEKREARFRGA